MEVKRSRLAAQQAPAWPAAVSDELEKVSSAEHVATAQQALDLVSNHEDILAPKGRILPAIEEIQAVEPTPPPKRKGRPRKEPAESSVESPPRRRAAPRPVIVEAADEPVDDSRFFVTLPKHPAAPLVIAGFLRSRRDPEAASRLPRGQRWKRRLNPSAW